MAVFKPGEPVETREPAVRVDPGLRPGVYRFQLVVVNQQGRSSVPDVITVVVQA